MLSQDDTERLARKLEEALGACPVPGELPAGFMDGIRLKIRQKQALRFRRLVALAGAAVILFGLGITWFISRPAVETGKIQPLQAADKFDELLAQVRTPADVGERIELFSRLSGTPDFNLSYNTVTDEFSFVSSKEPGNLLDNGNHWEVKLQKLADKCFPNVKELTCVVADGKGTRWSVCE